MSKIKTSIRLEEKTKEMLDQISTIDKRSLTAEIEWLIERRYKEIIEKEEKYISKTP